MATTWNRLVALLRDELGIALQMLEEQDLAAVKNPPHLSGKQACAENCLTHDLIISDWLQQSINNVYLMMSTKASTMSSSMRSTKFSEPQQLQLILCDCDVMPLP